MAIHMNHHHNDKSTSWQRSIIVILILGLALSLSVLYYQPAQSATITVNTFVDEPLSDPDNGNCSLREAIQAANSDLAVDACDPGSGADVVNVPGGSLYLLSAGEIVIFTDMEIVGEGRNTTIIDAAGTSNIFRQSGSPSSLAIRHLTLRNSLGSALDWGGSIGSGLATVEDVLFYNNSTTFKGGAINNEWELSVTNCSFQFNSATGGTNNYGGAISSTGTTSITNSDFISNQADISAPTGGGGGAIAGGGLTIVDSSFVSNQAKIGGALNISGTNRISNSTFSYNSAQTFNGGAIFATNSGTSISNSTISQNTNGGVAVQTGGELFIQSSTFYDNTGAANINGTITIKNSMLFSFSGGTNCPGVITSGGYNLDNNSTCSLGGTGDVSGVDPMLGLLLDNGGPTKTHALKYGSPAIDAGNPAGCTDDLGSPIIIDQRGWSRQIDGDLDGSAICDMGAYEKTIDLFLPLIMR